MGIFNWLGGWLDRDDTTSGFGDIGSPSVNIDGSPMIGDFDIHGHPYGVTDDLFDSTGSGCDDLFGSNMGSSCFDDF